ncbi:MAG: glycosyltransferase [Nibricoccus sp.]
MSLPLVSVCIPSYQADDFIGDALASIAAQTYEHWEVVVTEDGTKQLFSSNPTNAKTALAFFRLAWQWATSR